MYKGLADIYKVKCIIFQNRKFGVTSLLRQMNDMS